MSQTEPINIVVPFINVSHTLTKSHEQQPDSKLTSSKVIRIAEFQGTSICHLHQALLL